METKSINVIITGATGMVGEGVLHECLNDPRIASITLLNRRSAGIIHPKVKEILLTDLFTLTDKEPGLNNADACFYCLGVTSVGKSEEEYTQLTYDLTLKIAKPLLQHNPGITFCYVSAKGTDNSEKGKTMWARVKGKTENALAGMDFGQFFAFRPFLLTPTKGLRNTHGFYKYITWLFPLGRKLYPEGFCTLRELALAMIHVGYQGYDKKVITPTDMVKLASS
ncbi:MAG TPA: epimerase [Puia sp.]|jgi:uncharacterized protein YbjT (DUF2867 family)